MSFAGAKSASSCLVSVAAGLAIAFNLREGINRETEGSGIWHYLNLQDCQVSAAYDRSRTLAGVCKPGWGGRRGKL